MSTMMIASAAGAAAAARAASRRREAERRRRQSDRSPSGHKKDFVPTYKETTQTRTLDNGWTIEETLRDGELVSATTFDEKHRERERRIRYSVNSQQGIETAHYDEQGKRHGEYNFTTLDGIVRERQFFNHGASDGDGVHFRLWSYYRDESVYKDGRIIEFSQYQIDPEKPDDKSKWLLGTRKCYDAQKRPVRTEVWRTEPHHYLYDLSQVSDTGETSHQVFNPDKTVALSEKHDKDNNLIEYIVDGQDKLQERLQEIKERKLAQERLIKRAQEANQKRKQERKEKSELVNRNAAKVKKAGRGLLTAMKAARRVGLLKTSKPRT